MNQIDCVVGPCLDAFTKSPTGTLAIVLFGTIAVFSLLSIIKKDNVRSRIRWSYPLVFSVLFLFTYFFVTMNCRMDMQLCNNIALAYSAPVALIGSMLFGYILVPNLYLRLNKTILSSELSLRLPAPVPVYIADSGKPFAFSYGGIGKWIVVSQGMLEIMDTNELNAVLLHEYGHLVNNTSFYQSSNFIYSKIPILHAFYDVLALENEEELAADEFAIKIQGTRKFIKAAKKKLKGYFDCT